MLRCFDDAYINSSNFVKQAMSFFQIYKLMSLNFWEVEIFGELS